VKVVWTDRALEQVREIFDYIARDRPNVAVDIANGLFDQTELLENTPEMGPVWKPESRSDLRFLLYTSYRIVYRVELDRVSVVSVRHTRRDADANAGSSE